jgi:prepilin-type N-terminal cleavage/methylation domain-containing protein
MNSRGVTLLELLVTLAVLGTIATVAGLSMRPPAQAHQATRWRSAVADARRQALATHVFVVIRQIDGDTIRLATALPDGRVIEDSVLPDAH